MKNIFKIDLSFYLYALIMILSGYINYIVIILLCLLVHELGHILAISICRYKINSITLYPVGSIIKTNIQINIKTLHLFFISVSGILFQVVLFFIFKDNGSFNYYLFKKINTSIILFNLLPIYPLDGYKIYLSITENFVKYKKLIKFLNVVSIIMIALFFYNTKNVIFLLILLILNINLIKNFKYYINKFYLERYIYNIRHKRRAIVEGIDSIYKNKFNIVHIGDKYLSETELFENMFNKRA